MGVVMVGLERIAGLLVRNSVHEELYLRSKVVITGREIWKNHWSSSIILYFSSLLAQNNSSGDLRLVCFEAGLSSQWSFPMADDF